MWTAPDRSRRTSATPRTRCSNRGPPMQESNEEVLSGKRGLPFAAQSVCYPGGIPGQLLTPAEPFYFIQKPDQVWMIWQRDHMVRRIYLTDKHSEVAKPSWFGESIGHDE